MPEERRPEEPVVEIQVEVWDVVDEASLESFPASDPPGWGSWHATTNAPRRNKPGRKKPAMHVRARQPAPYAWLALAGLAMLAVIGIRLARR